MSGPASTKDQVVLPEVTARWDEYAAKIMWWLSFCCLLVIANGILQFAVLLLQAERIRASLQPGLTTAQLRHTSLDDVREQIERALQPFSDRAALQLTSSKFPSSSFLHPPSWYVLEDGVLRADVRIPSRDLLPRWLGPRVPGLTPAEIFVSEEVVVIGEE